MSKKALIALLLSALLASPASAAKSESLVVPGYPRGNVRVADLDKYRIDVGDKFNRAGKLVFKRGKRVLYEADFKPDERATLAALPDAVRQAAKPGALITWGFYPTKGKPKIAKFKVVKDDPRLSKRIARMEKQLKGKPEATIHQQRAQLLLNKKLYTAAYLEALRAVELNPAKASRALAVMKSATQRMKLSRTPIWDEIEQGADESSKRIKARRKGFKGRTPR